MAEDLSVPVLGTQGSAPVASRTTVVWHPKLTPYRALNLMVGIGMGSLKVLLVYKGVVLASIAVEWVLGTVIFVILYVLGMYEENSKNNHRGRSWFFNYDCMILFWRLIKRFGIEPPVYSTEEDPDSDTALSGPQALVTNYRLLVSAIVVGFGMAKASLAYRNLNSDATVLDWIFGVVVTSLLYIVGLYENNPAKRLKSLFDRNDSEAAFKMFIETFLATCCLIILPIPLFVPVFCVSSISTFMQFCSGFDKLDYPGGEWIYLSAMALLALTIDVTLAVSYVGLFSPIWTAVILHQYIAPNAVLGRRLASYAQQHDVEWLTHVVHRTGFVRVYSERFNAIANIANPIILCLFGLVALLCCSLMSFGAAAFAFPYGIGGFLLGLMFLSAAGLLAAGSVAVARVLGRNIRSALGYT